MSYSRVKEYFTSLGLGERVRELDTSSATVELAAQALNCECSQIAKTMAFIVNGGAILVVTCGDTKIDNAKFKSTFGVKAKMLTPDELLTLVGHEAGGVCPFAVNEGVKVYLDESLKRFEKVYPAAGSHNGIVDLSTEELVKYSSPVAWVDVCKQV